MIEVRLLGSIDLRGNDGRDVAAILAQPKRLALLAYLAAARPRGFHRRDKLLALFWPDFDDTRARQALNKTVHHLRRILGESAIVSRGDQELSIDDTIIRCDVRTFDEAIAAGQLELALEQYRGDLADGLFVDEAPEFDQWLSGERDRLRVAAAKAAGSLADRGDISKTPAAIEWARLAVNLSPYDEPAVRRLMVALERSGDRAGSAYVYDEFARKLLDELSLVPSPQTTALRDSLASGVTETATAAGSSSASPPPSLGITSTWAATTAKPQTRPLSRRRLQLTAALILLATLIASVIVLRGSPRAPRATTLDDKRVIVAVLENRTGDTTLDVLGPMAADWMTQGLSNADIVRVVDSRNVLVLTGSGSRSPRELANASGAGLVISGAYYKQGDSVRFQVQLSAASNSDVIQAFRPVVAPSTNPAEALEELRQQALSIVAQAATAQFASMVRSSSRPPLYIAYREYIEGVDLYVHRDQQRAYTHFIRAAQLDTTFTVALLSAASLAQIIGAGSVDSLVQELSLRRDSLSATSRLWLDATTAAQRGDPAEASRLLGQLAREVPQSAFPYMYANSLLFLGRVREAAAAMHDIDPQRGWMNGFFSYWVSRAMMDHMLGDRAAEEADVVAGERQYPRHISHATAWARLLASSGRRAQLDSLLDEVVSMPAVPGWDAGSVMGVAALEAAAHGHADWVPAIRDRALHWFNAIPAAEREHEAPQYGYTWVLYSVGAWPELEARVARLAREAPVNRRWLALNGLIAAHAGDTTAARRVDSILARKIETGEGGARNAGPIRMDRARILAMLGKRDAAVELLRQALATGAAYNGYLHADLAFASVKDYPPFVRVVTPKD